jgi:hypothetical protein
LRRSKTIKLHPNTGNFLRSRFSLLQEFPNCSFSGIDRKAVNNVHFHFPIPFMDFDNMIGLRATGFKPSIGP